MITLLVLLVDASLKSRSPAPARTLAAQTWVDRVLPIIAQSTQQGIEINQVRTSGLSMTAAEINSELGQVASSARSSLAALRSLSPPSTVEAANGLLTACLQTRAAAAVAFASAMQQVLSGAPVVGTAPTRAVLAAVQQFQVSDQAYQLFVQDFPPLGLKMPASSWYTQPAAFSQPALSTYLQALRAATNSVPVQDLAIAAVSTNPGAVSANGAVQVLPPASLVGVDVTVANVGNQPDSQVPVTASISPASPGYAGSARQLVSLAPGQDLALTVATLKAPINVPVTLTVSVGPVPGETNTADNTKTLVFEMP